MLYKDYATIILVKLKNAIEISLSSIAELVEFPKNFYLLSPGKKCTYYYILESGILANYYLKDGEEIITSFTFPGDIGADFKTAVLQLSSDAYIRTLTSVTAYRISVSDFERLKIDNTDLEDLQKQLVIAYALLLEERLKFIQHTTAVERYRFLMENYPQFIKSIPARHIASYIGVKVETLSRIKSQV